VTDSKVTYHSNTATSETENAHPNGFSRLPSHTFEHLSCFLPGLLALGAATLELPAADKERHEWAAIGLAYTCWLTYADQSTGLGPDEMSMKHWLKDEDGLWVNQLAKWEKQGRPTGRPPGLREGPSENEQGYRDYLSHKKTYLLRPEVRFDCDSLFLFC